MGLILAIFRIVFFDSNRGTGKSLILGYTGSLFAPKYGNPPSGMRFVVPGIFGLFCVTKINKKVFNEARLEKYLAKTPKVAPVLIFYS